MTALCALLMVSAAGPALALDDEEKHFGISALCGAGAETALHYTTEWKAPTRILAATALGSLPGLAKEIADSTEADNEFSESDMTADVLGALTGSLLGSLFNDTVKFGINTIDGERRLSFSVKFKF
ncbi:MAG: hypothetical protein HY343_04230 [Lentisphaerae bacterium]|nr:hypothetical protein [Lentisphaerota bacterium]